MKSILMGTAGRSQDGALLFGDMDKGFYGEVKAADFITSADLSTLCNFTAGTLVADVDWFKFAYQGKKLYVAKKNIRNTFNGNVAGFSALLDGSQTVVVRGKTYKVRGLLGVAGQEWDSLMYPLHVSHPSGAPNWGSYSDADMGIGLHSFCQEKQNTNMLARGRSGITYAAYLIPNNNGSRGWRPVLELVD